MRLLITTQAVDLGNPVLGFFHAWITELAGRVEQVEVICLYEGEHRLPSNVRVHSLGKEKGRKSRLIYTLRFLRLAWSLRREYDAVFVHMNQEYVLLSGLLWRVLGKRLGLWRNHTEGSVCTRLAGLLAHRVFYTSPEAYVAGFRNAHRMPVGIESERFSTAERNAPPDSVLFLGRIDPVKRPDVIVDAIAQLNEAGTHVTLSIFGSPTDPRSAYYRTLRERSKKLEDEGLVSFRGPVRHADTPLVYASHRLFVNLTQAGSLDKTVFEAMAAGCLVLTGNPALRDVIAPPLFLTDTSAGGVAQALTEALRLGPEEEANIRAGSVEAARKHGLDTVCAMLITYLDPHGATA